MLRSRLRQQSLRFRQGIDTMMFNGICLRSDRPRRERFGFMITPLTHFHISITGHFDSLLATEAWTTVPGRDNVPNPISEL
jgi:hypothetical protein